MADMISALPDTILCHILSFLPTKHAVATSILSKRWNPLWRWIPTLNFDDETYITNKETYYRFVQSVYAAIVLRDSHQHIQKLRLRCSSSNFCNPNDVDIWINAAVQRRVEHLHISLPFQWYWDAEPFVAIISCTTLVVLKLDYVAVQTLPSFSFPSLKILHMYSVRFYDHRHISEFLSGCPIVEDLKAIQIYVDNHFTGSGEFKILPNLVRAIIEKRDTHLYKVANNAKFLHIDEMDEPLSEDEMDTDEEIDDNEHMKPGYKDFLPVFHNLTHIELSYGTHYTVWIDVVEILKRCPKLQVLVINKRCPHIYPNEGGYWSKRQSVPKCVSLHLKTCCLSNYKGLQGEFQFASYIMRNARFLRTMTISCSRLVNRREKLKMLKRLSLSTRRSAACKLSFK